MLPRPCGQRIVEEVPMPSFAPRSAREHRWYVVALLVACGLSPGVAGKAYALGQSVRRHMTQARHDERVEWGDMIDSATGALIGSLLEGERKGVNLGPHIAALQAQPGTGGVSIHTHPGNSSFSEYDAKILIDGARHGVRAIVVVGADNTWYVMSLKPGEPSVSSFADVLRQYEDAFEATDPLYQAMVHFESIDEKRAWAAQSHLLWETIAPALGVRYDRVEPPRKP
jgi:hypothetical protein